MKTAAILVGASVYQDKRFETLPGAHHDATRFAASLKTWGLPKQSITLLTEEKATKANIVKTFYEYRSWFDVDAKLIFYFAGHGIRQNYKDEVIRESALIPYDTDFSEPLSSGLRLVELMQLIRSLKPHQVFVFIDACSLRLNQIDNPFSDTDIFSATNSKGFFCMLSSGIQSSYEDDTYKYGYFTQALLQVISQLEKSQKANCNDLVKMVGNLLANKALPYPEVYHIGCEEMWLLEHSYAEPEVSTSSISTNSGRMVLRKKALAELHHHFLVHQSPLIWLWGEGGRGKSIQVEQLCQMIDNSLCISVPTHLQTYSLIEKSLIEQIRQQKGELFFNRPFDACLSSALNHLPEGCLIAIDHLDRLNGDDLNALISNLDQTLLPTVLVSRNRCPKPLFQKRFHIVTELYAPALELDEIEQMMAIYGLDTAYSGVMLKATAGNAQKLRQFIVKISAPDVTTKGNTPEELIMPIRAIVACGGFCDEYLFCKTFNISSKSLLKLEKMGLLRYSKEGCYPHDVLSDIVQENQWQLELFQAALYWNSQIQMTPYNSWACRSLVFCLSSTKERALFKQALEQCLETLNEREYLNFLIDIVTIALEENWEELLIKASKQLILFEEFGLVHEVSERLALSSNPKIKRAAIANLARKFLWLGDAKECIRLSELVLTESDGHGVDPNEMIFLKNNIGIAYFFIGDFQKSLSILSENLQSCGKDECELYFSKALLSLDMILIDQDIDKARNYLQESLLFFEITQNYPYIMITLNILAYLCISLDQINQGIIYSQRALDIAEILQHKTYKLFSRYTKAILFIRRYGVFSEELSQVEEEMLALLADMEAFKGTWSVLFALTTLATHYAIRKEISKLEAMNRACLPYSVNFRQMHAYTLSNLGHLAAWKKQDVQAKEYYREAYSLCKKMNSPFIAAELKQAFLNCGFHAELQSDCQSLLTSMKI